MTMTNHAHKRAAQRNVDMDFVVKYGKKMHNAGGTFYQLRRKDIPSTIAPNDRRRKLAGTTVLACRCGETWITTYRNDKAFKADRKKNKWHQGERSPHPCQTCDKTAERVN